MYLSIRLDDDSVELMQSDIEDMWNYLEQDTENFVSYSLVHRRSGLGVLCR